MCGTRVGATPRGCPLRQPDAICLSLSPSTPKIFAWSWQRAQLQSELVSVGEEATALAQKALNDLADDARQRISDATADQVELRDGLRHLVDELRNHITSGEALLSGLRDGS
jgi:hypothetical protein